MSRYRTRVLCVDDEKLNREMIKDMLADEPIELYQAADGLQALKILEEHQIDLVLLDIVMPRMDGFAVCRRIKDDDRTRGIPVIVLTSLGSLEDRVRGIEAGAEDFITKPFEQAEVLARIRMLLKVRSLNQRLYQAYESIKNLTMFGEALIQTFSPSNFDLLFSIDSVVSQLIRQRDEVIGRPETVLFGVHQGEKDEIFRYEIYNGRLRRQQIDMPWRECMPASLEPVGRSFTYEDRQALEGSPFSALIEHLEKIGIGVENMVAYVSSNICLATLNYLGGVTPYDAAVLESLVMQALFLRSLASQVSETEDAFTYTVHSLARAAEANDEDTGNHILRVGEYCTMIAERLRLSDKFIRAIRIQATLHDIGKIHTPPSILKKPGRLNADEWTQMKLHTVYGARIIGDHSRFALARSIAISHHERWDGSGYPGSLRENSIPVEGRIVTLADTYDALRNHRVYKPAFDHKTALTVITEGDDRSKPHHYDPAVLSAFKELASRFEEVYEKLS